MDVLSIPEIKKHYRVLINRKNKIYLNEIDEKESKFKLRRVTGKTVLKGNRLQLNLHDSNNIITKEKVNVGDSVIFEFGKGITGKIELKEGNTAYLTGGKHVGLFGSIVKIIETKRRRDEIIIKVGDREIKTAKRHAFVVGEKEPKITLK
jgi:small subunit ribosomal protein S4e